MMFAFNAADNIMQYQKIKNLLNKSHAVFKIYIKELVKIMTIHVLTYNRKSKINLATDKLKSSCCNYGNVYICIKYILTRWSSNN